MGLTSIVDCATTQITVILVFYSMHKDLNSEQLQYKVFDWLRFPLIVGVVFIHCFGKPFDFSAIDFGNLSGEDYYNLFRVSISHVLTHVCVPTFYFISGYLFFKGLETWDWTKYVSKLKRRVKTLLVPFLIWNTIAIVLKMLVEYKNGGVDGISNFIAENNYWHMYWDCKEWNVDRTNWIGWGSPASSPYLVPLWFLRDLMIVVLCSPIIHVFFRHLKIVGVIILVCCYVTGVFIKIPGFSDMAFLFFGTGAYMKMNSINPTEKWYHYRIPIFGIAFLLWIVCTIFDGHNTKEGDIIYPFFVIIGFVATLNLATCIVDKNILRMPVFLSKASFFIYLSHTILVIKVFNKLSQMILTIVFCLSVYYVLNKYIPSLCNVLTGER